MLPARDSHRTERPGPSRVVVDGLHRDSGDCDRRQSGPGELQGDPAAGSAGGHRAVVDIAAFGPELGFFGGDQPTLYPMKLPNEPTTGQVFLTLACYNAKDAAPGHATIRGYQHQAGFVAAK